MRIERARLRDTPVLAWVAVQAFAAESSRTGVRRRAPEPVSDAFVLLGLTGRWWPVVALREEGDHRHRAYEAADLVGWLMSVGICAAIVIGLVMWISLVDSQGLQLLTVIMKAVGVLMVILLVLLLPAKRIGP